MLLLSNLVQSMCLVGIQDFHLRQQDFMTEY